ncbi:MAG: DUF211 domain-containing protein [Haloarculaceae archaeon]
MVPVRRLVVDVLKPHDPPLLEFARRVGDAEGVEGISASLIELDNEVQNVKLTFEGEALAFEEIEAAVERLGGTVHSVDQVACGERVVEDRPTHQDR